MENCHIKKIVKISRRVERGQHTVILVFGSKILTYTLFVGEQKHVSDNGTQFVPISEV